jgi:hypothetical protein
VIRPTYTMCEEQNFCSYSATCRPVLPFFHSSCALCIKRASVERATPPVKSTCTRGASPRRFPIAHTRNRTSAQILPPADLPPPFSTHPVHSVLKGRLWSVPLRQSSQRARGEQVHAGSRSRTQGTELLLKFCHLPTCPPPFPHSSCALCIKRASVERATPYSIVLESDQLTQCARNRTSAHILPPADLSPLFTLMLCTLY